MSDAELRLALDALWDNSIDGRIADRKYASDFERQEADLKESFLAFLRGTSPHAA